MFQLSPRALALLERAERPAPHSLPSKHMHVNMRQTNTFPFLVLINLGLSCLWFPWRQMASGPALERTSVIGRGAAWDRDYGPSKTGP